MLVPDVDSMKRLVELLAYTVATISPGGRRDSGGDVLLHRGRLSSSLNAMRAISEGRHDTQAPEADLMKCVRDYATSTLQVLQEIAEQQAGAEEWVRVDAKLREPLRRAYESGRVIVDDVRWFLRSRSSD